LVQNEGMIGKLTGKVILITGCSSGIGVDTARALLATGAHVFVTARDDIKGKQVVEELLASNESSAGQVSLLHLELDSLASVRACATDFLAKSKQLNVLITNAGEKTLLRMCIHGWFRCTALVALNWVPQGVVWVHTVTMCCPYTAALVSPTTCCCIDSSRHLQQLMSSWLDTSAGKSFNLVPVLICCYCCDRYKYHEPTMELLQNATDIQISYFAESCTFYFHISNMKGARRAQMLSPSAG